LIVAGAQPTSECPMALRANDVHGRVLTVQAPTYVALMPSAAVTSRKVATPGLKFDICSGLTSTPADMQPRGLDRQDG
jgi:hypothetical protein